MAHAVAAMLGAVALAACGDSRESALFPAGPEAPSPTTTGAEPTAEGAPSTSTQDGSQDGVGVQPQAETPAVTEVVTGCAAVYDPGQVLHYDLRLSDADWQALIADTTNSVYFSAELRCDDGAPLRVALRRKRSGGTTKVGLKVDINREVAEQTFHGLKKLSLENGISEGDESTSARSLLSEFLAWRLMVLSGAVTGRAAMARVTANQFDLGVYVSVEQVDKAFLSSRLGDDSGWLYKKSGNDDGDGYQTREGEPNPFETNLCFWDQSCPAPAPNELPVVLPAYLDIEQLLRVAAVQALIGNTDAFPLKNNNVIFYDWTGGGRMYFPWDLDTTMTRSFDVFTGRVPGGTSRYVDMLFSNWRADYGRILTELVNDRLRLDVILAEIDAVLEVAGNALAADPWLTSDASEAEQLKSWWRSQHAAVVASLDAQ